MPGPLQRGNRPDCVKTGLLLRPPSAPPPRPEALPVHVVHYRPGGNVAQAEAVRMLRRHLARTVSSECLAVMGKGSAGNVYRFAAVNRCDHTPLGNWEVNAKSGAVTRR